MNVVIGLIFLLLSLFFGALAALSLRVLIDLLRAGPSAALEAYEKGHSLSRWWNGDPVERTTWSRDA